MNQNENKSPIGETLQSDKMRVKKVGRLLAEMSLPAIISMLVQSLYNIVDSLFVANITSTVLSPNYAGTALGDDSFTAVSVAYPLTMLVIAIGIGIGVGANAYIARKLGEGNPRKASRAAQHAVILVLSAWAVLCVLAFTVVKPFVSAFVTAENATDVGYVVQQAEIYLTIYMAGSLGSMIELVFGRMLQATGNMKVPMISQLIGAVTNIALDALFILVFKWGVTGAIVATVIGQWLAAAFAVCVFVFRKQDVSVSLKGFKADKGYFGRILEIGLPAFVMNAMGSVITVVLNIILKSYPSGIFVLSAYFKVQSFVFMPVFGLMQGAMPIMSYNYGANLKERFVKTFRLSLYISLAIMAAGTILFQSVPEYIMRILTDDPVKIADGVYAFRVISISFIPAAFSIVVINMLQSINKPVSSLLMSLCRQLVVLLPCALLFDYLWHLTGIWFCYPVAEIVSITVFIPVAVMQFKKQFMYKQRQYDEGLIAAQKKEINP